MSTVELHTHWITSSGEEGSSGLVGARFPYWSFTKTVIAIAALQLVEAGKLELDTTLSNYPYTLRQLLAHTSGLPDYGGLPDYHQAVAANEPPWPREYMLDRALQNGLLFDPGNGWSYSNIGYMMVGDLIEEATAEPLGDVIADQICRPLGLTSIDLPQSREQFARLHWDAAANYDPRWVYHGCLAGTAADASRLLHALVTGDLLKPETLDQMFAKRLVGGPIPGRPWRECGYGLGLMSGTMGNAGEAVGHSGAGPFSVNAVYHFPGMADPITVACFTSGTDEGVAEFAAAKIAQTNGEE